MRKLLLSFLSLVAIVAAAVSCANEIDPEGAIAGAGEEVTFKVFAPEDVMTKAISDGTGAKDLKVAVYDEAGTYLANLTAAMQVTGNSPWSVTVPVVKDLTYQFVFFAHNADDNGFYTFNASEKTLKVDYEKLASNDDKADAFYSHVKFKVENTFTKEITLRRPLAQLNIGASDLTAASYSIDVTSINLGVELTGIYDTMNLLDSTVTNQVNVNYAKALRVTEATQFVEGFDRIGMVYALVDQAVTSSATINITANGAGTATEKTITRSVSNVPLKRNYRTNILGTLFTNIFTFTVTTDPGFYHDAYSDVNVPDYYAEATSIAALNTLFADGLMAATLNVASGETGTIILPNVTGDVYLNILGDFSGDKEITLTYAANLHPANLYIYAPNLYKLDGDLPDTHVEINSYSHIDTGVMSTSGTTLVIQPFAYYGNLIIKKGGLKVEGIKDPQTGEYVKDDEDNEAKGIVGSVTIDVSEGGAAAIENNGLIGDETTQTTAVSVISGTTAITGEGTVEGDVEAKGENTYVTVSTEVTGEVNVSESATVTISTEVEVNNVDNTGTINTGDGYTYDDTTGEVIGSVAKIGTNYYPSLAAAVAAAQAGDTIELLKDDEVSLTAGGEIVIDKSLKITGAVDTKGNPLYTVFGKSTVAGTNDIFINGSGTVTLSNLKVKNFGNDANTDAGHAPIYVSQNFTGTVNLSNVYVSDFNRGGIFLYGGAFNVDDCYIDCANSRANAFTKGIEIKGNASGTISDTFICNMERSSATYSTAGIEIYGSGSITVDGCTIVSDNGNHQAVKATYGIVSSRVGVHNPSGGSTLVKDCMFDCTNACLSISDDDEYGPVNNYSFTVTDCDFNNYIATWSSTSSITINSGSFAEDVYADAGTIIIHGGEFANFAPYAETGASIIIDGGIFDSDPTNYLAEGCTANKISDTQWEVVAPAIVNYTFTSFNEAVLENNGVFDGAVKHPGEKVVVTLNASERSIRNNNTAQFYLARRTTDETINGIESVTIKNVTFKYNHDADDGSTELNTGEVYFTAMNILAENCTFTENSGLSSWGYLGSDQNPPISMTIKNCTFKDLTGRYAIHQNRAKSLSVTGCTFTNCERGIHTNSPAPTAIVIKDNTFTGISESKGVLCLAEGMTNIKDATLEITGNVATDQAMLRSLNASASAEQIKAIRDNNTFGTLYTNNSSYMPELP